MVTLNPEQLWFNTPDSETLCRGGGNGPDHPTQLYAIKKYVESGMSFLDYGCGSGTTLEALLKYAKDKPNFHLNYLGLDIIPKNVEWCRKQWPDFRFQVNHSIHKIDQPDYSWDTVYSRHVVDHMDSFERALDEHCRVARKLVIVTLWVPFSNQDEHEIKNIDYRPSGGELYPNEYTNSYSKKKVMEYLQYLRKFWKILEVTEDVGSEVSGHDTVICLERLRQKY